MNAFSRSLVTFFEHLEIWTGFPLELRTWLARDLPADLRVAPEHLDRLREAGWTEGDAPVLESRFRPFRRAVRSLYRYRIFDDADLIGDYMQEHFGGEETRPLTQWMAKRYGSGHWNLIQQLTLDEAWPAAFLDAPSGRAWEDAFEAFQFPPLLDNEAVCRQLIRWIRLGLKEDNPLPLGALEPGFQEDPTVAAAALTAGVRYLFLFPAFSSEALDPVLGLLPPVHQRLNRPEPEEPVLSPAPPEGLSVYNHAFVLDDLTIFMTHISPKGYRLTAGGDLYKPDAERLSDLLGPLPEGIDFRTSLTDRLQNAMVWAKTSGWVEITGKTSRKGTLKATPTGAAWLDGSTPDRLQALLDILRAAFQERKTRTRGWNERTHFTLSDLQTKESIDS
ncbi:MAG: hypothetical protein AAF492_15105, partial [Verrucomicrobiota bacterium]